MAWQWTDVKQIDGIGRYAVTAEERSDPENIKRISFQVHKDRVTPALILDVFEKKVAKMNAIETDEGNKLAWAIANIDISGVA